MSEQSGHMLECRAILFDLDGVLVDSTSSIERVWNSWARSHGLDPEEVVRTAHGRPTIDTLTSIAPNLHAEHETAMLAAAELSELDGTRSMPGAIRLLKSLPINQWAVVTSGMQEIAQARLRYVALPIPGVLVTADAVKRGKPHPDGYLTAAGRLGISPTECLVVEDAAPGIQAARAAGMRSIGLTTTHARSALAEADEIVEGLEQLNVLVSADGRIRITIAKEAVIRTLR